MNKLSNEKSLKQLIVYVYPASFQLPSEEHCLLSWCKDRLALWLSDSALAINCMICANIRMHFLHISTNFTLHTMVTEQQ